MLKTLLPEKSFKLKIKLYVVRSRLEGRGVEYILIVMGSVC
jgi:hypothetical protein